MQCTSFGTVGALALALWCTRQVSIRCRKNPVNVGRLTSRRTPLNKLEKTQVKEFLDDVFRLSNLEPDFSPRVW